MNEISLHEYFFGKQPICRTKLQKKLKGTPPAHLMTAACRMAEELIRSVPPEKVKEIFELVMDDIVNDTETSIPEIDHMIKNFEEYLLPSPIDKAAEQAENMIFAIEFWIPTIKLLKRD